MWSGADSERRVSNGLPQTMRQAIVYRKRGDLLKRIHGASSGV
jgi:hypothetical protein